MANPVPTLPRPETKAPRRTLRVGDTVYYWRWSKHEHELATPLAAIVTMIRADGKPELFVIESGWARDEKGPDDINHRPQGIEEVPAGAAPAERMGKWSFRE